MLPARSAVLGDTLPFYLVLETDENGAPWTSFEGCALKFTLKANPADPDASALVRLSSAAEILAGTTAYWELQTEQLRAAGPGRYYYDLQLARPAAARVITIERGLLYLTPDITQQTA